MGLIRLVFIVLCIYLAFKWIIKPILKIALYGFVKKTMEKQSQQFYGGQQRPNRAEGSINVDYIPKQKGTEKNNNTGEYVDFEEVK